MRNSTKKLSVILLSFSLLLSQSANAARMGKSSNSGMQRSVTTTNTTSNSASPSSINSAGQGAANQAQPRSGMGAGAVVAGAAAGALGGYMLGKASNNRNSSQTQSQQNAPESQFPWGIIAILGLLLVIGLMMFRRRTPALNTPNGPAGFPNNSPQQNNNFNIPNIKQNSATYVPGQYTNGSNTNAAGQPQVSQPAQSPQIEKLPDGVETQYFIRQVKGMFLHIQSMNTPENVAEVEKYMTPELYSDVRETITGNDYVADFSQLDCRLLDATTENAKYIASVMFSGKVSEAPNSPAVDFSEIWHFIKPASDANAKWLVAGIQQVSQA